MFRIPGLALLLTALALAACDTVSSPEPRAARGPVAFHAHDECHVCGMIIDRFPGPKGQIVAAGDAAPKRFCSTRDLFAFLLQPENRSRRMEVYVHDMERTDWQDPDPSPATLVDARTAWYVADHPLPGSMGGTLASFAERRAAAAFAAEHGGRVLAFEDVTLKVIGDLRSPGARTGDAPVRHH